MSTTFLILLGGSALIGFLFTYLITPWFIRYLKKIGLLVHDMNKKDKPLVPISGGLAVFGGFFVAMMVFIFLFVFFGDHAAEINLLHLFAGLMSIFIITLIGFLDDLVIGGSHKVSIGLKQWQKPLLTLGAAVPLMAVNAGVSTMIVPFFGHVKFGLFYPLLLVPIGLVGASNMVNMLAGFNGMETGMALIYIGMLGLYGYVHDRTIVVLIAAFLFFTLLAFFLFNKYPAKILPGDSLTYLLGGSLAVIAILGNIERAALIISIPFFIEFILKARKKFKADNFGEYKEGKIISKYDKIYSITHLLTKTGKFTEQQISWLMMGITLVFSLLIWVV